MPRDLMSVLGGAFFLALGLYVFVTAFGFGIGTARRMGAGYFPMVLGAVAMLLGLGIAVDGLRARAERPRIAWKPFFAVVAGLAAFWLLVDRAGLVPAVCALVGLSLLADRTVRPLEALGLMAGVSLLLWLIFSVALGLPIPAFEGLG